MTNELGISINDNRVVVSSRDVARVFEKEHFNVLQSIRNLECSESFAALNFQVSLYKDKTGRELREYLITRDGFTLLAMGFTGSKAMQFKEEYIAAFNAMEKELKISAFSLMKNVPQTFAAALRRAADLEEQRAALVKTIIEEQLIAERNPKRDYIDCILQDCAPVSIAKIAEDYGKSVYSMHAIFNALKVNDEHYELALQHQNRGYLSPNNLWTQKGRLFLYNLLKENGILPLIER